MSAPYSTLKVLDFSRVLAGPFATMLLADFGAQVVKVERPGSGDETRAWGPPWVGTFSAYYLSVNRNKQSITLNLKTAKGRDLARRLALQADVLVENFKVGQMQSFGLDYPTLSAENPGLIYCSLTGFGQDGPYAKRPGYDYAIQAMSGLMSITGPSTGEAYKVGVAISDVVTGLYAVNSIQTALFHRQLTGQGQAIDIALLDAQIGALVNVASNYLVSGQVPPRYGNGHPNIVPYQSFSAADGAVVIAAGNDGQFMRLCQLIEREDLMDDPRFATNPARVENRELLTAILAPIVSMRPARWWVEHLLAVNVPAALVQDMEQVFQDPHVLARQMVHDVTLASGESVLQVSPVPKLSQTPPQVRHAPPALGQHTARVLADWLGLSVEEIDDLGQAGVI